jgi:phospholipase/carboxylesterase
MPTPFPIWKVAANFLLKMMMALETIEIETGPNPTATVLLMHGLGADGNDFVPIVGEMDFSAIGNVRFVFPNAPIMPVTINGGYKMPAWYDIIATDLGRQEDEAGLRKSRLSIEELLAKEKARGIPANRIVIAGFSQGCAMALMVGLRHEEKLAGIVGMSGYLPIAATTAAERTQANAATPIFLAHGRHDDVVPMPRATASKQALDALGYAVEWKDYPMPHSVCAEEIQDLNKWLAKVLA